MKSTKQRKIILEIINNSCDHLDAYGIYQEARKTISNISLGTVYRNLKVLADNNLIDTIKENGQLRYDKNVKHAHFICNKCNNIIDIYDLKIPDIKTINGNIVTDYKIVLKGNCLNCQKEE